MNKYDILCSNQCGFRKGHSTSLALVDLYDKISEAIDKKEVAVGVFLDLSKAFDTVNHDIFFQKLEHYGVRGIVLSVIKSYFSDRQQFVQFNNARSIPMWSTTGINFRSVVIFDIYQ